MPDSSTCGGLSRLWATSGKPTQAVQLKPGHTAVTGGLGYGGGHRFAYTGVKGGRYDIVGVQLRVGD